MTVRGADRDPRRRPEEQVDPALTRSLLRGIWADPPRLPELLADFAVRQTGPRADRAVTRLREQHGGAEPAGLRMLTVTRGVRRTTAQGSVVGGPFIALVPVAFCAALLAQSQTVLELAALAGRDPTDPARAAELLVLQGAYPDELRARAALAALGSDRSGRPMAGRRRRWSTTSDVIRRMARLLGLTSRRSDHGAPLRHLRRACQWGLLGLVLMVGLVAPLVWLPYLGAGYHRATVELTDRATTLYLLEHPEAVPAGVDDPTGRAPRSYPAMLAAGLRVAAALLLPIGAVALVLLTDLRLFGSRWPVLALTVIGLSLLTGSWWYVRRRRSGGGGHRHPRTSSAAR